MIFEIRFQVESDSEPDVRDLTEALYEAFIRAQSFKGRRESHVANVVVIGRQVACEG